jgi:hypothetical protein
MRFFFITILGMALALCTRAQGTFVFGNRFPELALDAPVFDLDCATRLDGPNFLSQVYVGFAVESLRPLGPIQEFRTRAGAGYFPATAIIVPGSTHGQTVYTQLRAWEAEAGSTYEEAVNSGGKFGFSNIVPVRVFEPPTAPVAALGLQSFCLIPEPSARAMIAAGIGVLITLRCLRGRLTSERQLVRQANPRRGA